MIERKLDPGAFVVEIRLVGGESDASVSRLCYSPEGAARVFVDALTAHGVLRQFIAAALNDALKGLVK